MIEISRKLEIRWKLNGNYFKDANKEVSNEVAYDRKIGPTINAVKAMTVRDNEMRVLMPRVLGISPSSSSDLNWDKAVSNYWNSLTIYVPSGGYPLEVGFRFDFQDSSKIVKIQELQKVLELKVDITTEELFAKYVMDNVSEYEKYLYGTPIDIPNYLLWRYCENYRDVANTPTSNKGSRVRFYIHDELATVKAKKATFATQQEAMKVYINLLSEKQKKRDVLWALGKGGKTDEMDIDMAIDLEARTRPEQFLATVNDNNLTTRARIERYVSASILRRIDNSSIIVDGSDPSVVIGNNMDDAITYFTVENPVNKQNISNYEIKYKALRSKIK